MKLSRRDLFFIIANAFMGAAIGLCVRLDIVSEDGVAPPLMMLFIGMAIMELAAGYVAKAPLGQYVGMPARFCALIASFAAFMLVRM